MDFAWSKSTIVGPAETGCLAYKCRKNSQKFSDRSLILIRYCHRVKQIKLTTCKQRKTSTARIGNSRSTAYKLQSPFVPSTINSFRAVIHRYFSGIPEEHILLWHDYGVTFTSSSSRPNFGMDKQNKNMSSSAICCLISRRSLTCKRNHVVQYFWLKSVPYVHIKSHYVIRSK